MPLLGRAFNWALNEMRDNESHIQTNLTTQWRSKTAIINIGRLAQIVPDIINNDQTGFVSNRLLSDNIRRTIDIIEYATRMQDSSANIGRRESF